MEKSRKPLNSPGYAQDSSTEFDHISWSGLRLEDRAVLRLVSQGEGAAQLELEPWPGSRIELEAPTGGRTYLVRKVGEKVEVIE